MKLEVVVVPVADVDRAKNFCNAQYMVDEQAGHPGPASPGAST